MQNQMFQLQSPEQRKYKLESVLVQKTNRMLSKYQIQQIVRLTNLSRQYKIRIHVEPETFYDALYLCRDHGSRDTGKIAFGDLRFGIIDDSYISNPCFSHVKQPAAVIMSRCRLISACQVFQNIIHIYLPKHEMRNAF